MAATWSTKVSAAARRRCIASLVLISLPATGHHPRATATFFALTRLGSISSSSHRSFCTGAQHCSLVCSPMHRSCQDVAKSVAWMGRPGIRSIDMTTSRCITGQRPLKEYKIVANAPLPEVQSTSERYDSARLSRSQVPYLRANLEFPLAGQHAVSSPFIRMNKHTGAKVIAPLKART